SARAASALPMSAVSQPNWSRMARTVCFAASSLPQMNIVGGPLADRVEGLDEACCGKLVLETLHQRLVESGEDLQYAARGRGVGDGICRVDDGLAGQVRCARGTQRLKSHGALDR